jgi:uncharacterized membrane protein YidH (DUF202 family)
LTILAIIIGAAWVLIIGIAYWIMRTPKEDDRKDWRRTLLTLMVVLALLLFIVSLF